MMSDDIEKEEEWEITFVPTYKKKLRKADVILGLIVAVSLIYGIYWYLKQEKPALYGAAIFQTGGSGSEEVRVAAYILDALDSEKTGRRLMPTKDYVGIYFKNQSEMWAYCAEGYGVIDVGSSAKNPILNPSTGNTQFEAGIELIHQHENTLQIACTRL